MKTLAERLKIAMAGPPKVRAADLARACGIKPPSVSDWLSGKTKSIDEDNLLKAARFLNVHPWWLASGKGEMRPGQPSENEPSYTAPFPPGAIPIWPFAVPIADFEKLTLRQKAALDAIMVAYVGSCLAPSEPAKNVEYFTVGRKQPTAAKKSS